MNLATLQSLISNPSSAGAFALVLLLMIRKWAEPSVFSNVPAQAISPIKKFINSLSGLWVIVTACLLATAFLLFAAFIGWYDWPGGMTRNLTTLPDGFPQEEWVGTTRAETVEQYWTLGGQLLIATGLFELLQKIRNAADPNLPTHPASTFAR